MILDYVDGPSDITRVLKNRRWRQKREKQRDGSVRRTWPATACSADEGATGQEVQAPLEAGKTSQVLPGSLQKEPYLSTLFFFF